MPIIRHGGPGAAHPRWVPLPGLRPPALRPETAGASARLRGSGRPCQGLGSREHQLGGVRDRTGCPGPVRGAYQRPPEMLVIETLKLHFATTPSRESGWLHALRDPVLGPALAAIHASPERVRLSSNIGTRSGAPATWRPACQRWVCRDCSQMCSRDHPRRLGTSQAAPLGKVQAAHDPGRRRSRHET